MTIFVAFFTVVSSILSIILFFKIWKMTNDVENIKKALKKQGLDEQERFKLFLLGEKDIVFKSLIDKVADEYFGICETIKRGKNSEGNIYNFEVKKTITSEEYFSIKFNSFLEKISPKFAEYGFEIPEEIKNLKYKEF